MALGINCLITLVESIGAAKSHSLGLLSNVIHDGLDVATILLALLAVTLHHQPCRRLGRFHRVPFESISCVIISLFLLVSIGLVGWHAVERLRHPQLISTVTMVGAAIVGLVGNLVVLWIMRCRNSTGVTRAVVIDAGSDTLFAAAVILSGGIISLTGWLLVDPLLSVLISGFILFNVVQMLRRTIQAWPTEHACS